LSTVGQTVEVVESNYQRLETSNATVSDIMDTKQVQNLPLNGRNPLALLTLEPGVVQRTTNGAGSDTHVFGSRDRSHNVTIDGVDQFNQCRRVRVPRCVHLNGAHRQFSICAGNSDGQRHELHAQFTRPRGCQRHPASRSRCLRWRNHWELRGHLQYFWQ